MQDGRREGHAVAQRHRDAGAARGPDLGTRGRSQVGRHEARPRIQTGTSRDALVPSEQLTRRLQPTVAAPREEHGSGARHAQASRAPAIRRVQPTASANQCRRFRQLTASRTHRSACVADRSTELTDSLPGEDFRVFDLGGPAPSRWAVGLSNCSAATTSFGLRQHNWIGANVPEQSCPRRRPTSAPANHWLAGRVRAVARTGASRLRALRALIGAWLAVGGPRWRSDRFPRGAKDPAADPGQLVHRCARPLRLDRGGLPWPPDRRPHRARAMNMSGPRCNLAACPERLQRQCACLVVEGEQAAGGAVDNGGSGIAQGPPTVLAPTGNTDQYRRGDRRACRHG